nr:hypothetical protein [Frankia sp. QA3]
MIAASYLAAAAPAVLLAVLFAAGALNSWTFLLLVAATFFYAVGTTIGGITGPLLFGHLIDTGRTGPVMAGFLVGAAVMAVGGVAELVFGVDAAGRSLEDIAAPLTVTEDGDEPYPDEPTRTSGSDRSGRQSAAWSPPGAAGSA